jgi:hypothetical protein
MRAKSAKAVLTTDYETTAWLRFYNPSLPVVAVLQPNRYLDSPPVSLGKGPYLYLADDAHDAGFELVGRFQAALQTSILLREGNGQVIALYQAILLNAPVAAIQGKSP